MQHSKLRIDADNAFLKAQTQSSVRNGSAPRPSSSTGPRDAKTARLKALRVETKRWTGTRLAADPPKRKPRRPASPWTVDRPE